MKIYQCDGCANKIKLVCAGNVEKLYCRKCRGYTAHFKIQTALKPRLVRGYFKSAGCAL